MNILWVKAGGLVPPEIGGKIRSYNILRELAKRHSVTLFTFYTAHSDDKHPELTCLFDRVVCHPLKVATARGLGEFLGFVRNTVSAWPYSVSKYCRPDVKARLRDVLSSTSYDVIVCDFVFAAGVIPWDEISAPKVLFTHNVEALIWQRHFNVSRNPFWKLVCWGEYQKMSRFERFCLAKSNHVLTVSETDRKFFSRFGNNKQITVIPTGVDTNYFFPSSVEETSNSIVFTGAMDWLPNEEAILHFLDSTFPLIRREIGDVTFTIVGRTPSDKLRARAAEVTGVRVTGTVSDIRPYVREASVYVVPLRVGSGTRLKIFEAMAMGKAIVSTSLGAEGLPVSDDDNILLADSDEEFAARVVLLMRNPRLRKFLGTKARRLVEGNYSWSVVASEFDAVLRSMSKEQRIYAGVKE